ncbi:MAG: potassium-transporting ATPase subunit C [Fidelibacterota bacterium]
MEEKGRKEDTEEMVSEESAAEEAREIPVPQPVSWRRRIFTSLRLLLFFVVVCSAAYPAVLLLAGELFWAEQAGGSIVYLHGRPAGSALIVQPFLSRPGAEFHILRAKTVTGLTHKFRNDNIVRVQRNVTIAFHRIPDIWLGGKKSADPDTSFIHYFGRMRKKAGITAL